MASSVSIKVSGEYKTCSAYKKVDGVWTSVAPQELSTYVQDKKIVKVMN